MVPHLEPEQLEKLNNVLYINFHGVEVQEQCTELTATGTDGDVAKVKMFVASKKAVNRQDNTLRQYTREIDQPLQPQPLLDAVSASATPLPQVASLYPAQ